MDLDWPGFEPTPPERHELRSGRSTIFPMFYNLVFPNASCKLGAFLHKNTVLFSFVCSYEKKIWYIIWKIFFLRTSKDAPFLENNENIHIYQTTYVNDEKYLKKHCKI